jgi:hypothetical protein
LPAASTGLCWRLEREGGRSQRTEFSIPPHVLEGGTDMRIRSRVLALLAAPALLLAACGGGGDGGGTQATAPPQPAKATVTVTASGKQVKFDVPAQLKPGATQLELVNNTKEPVELQIVRLDGGHTLAEFYPAIESQEPAPIPEWLHAFGGVGETGPGQRRSVVVDLKAGRYAWFSGSAPDRPGAQPQYRRGGEGSFEVTGDPSGAQLPAAAAQITAKELGPTDYRFEASGLKAGTNQITFTNSGAQLHHVIMAKLNKGATVDKVMEFFATEKGPPPVDFDASEITAVLDTGGRQVETVQLQSGSYALMCFITDRAGSPPHAIKAKMVQEVKVA